MDIIVFWYVILLYSVLVPQTLSIVCYLSQSCSLEVAFSFRTSILVWGVTVFTVGISCVGAFFLIVL
jgi:hypothetical protein